MSKLVLLQTWPKEYMKSKAQAAKARPVCVLGQDTISCRGLYTHLVVSDCGTWGLLSFVFLFLHVATGWLLDLAEVSLIWAAPTPAQGPVPVISKSGLHSRWLRAPEAQAPDEYIWLCPMIGPLTTQHISLHLCRPHNRFLLHRLSHINVASAVGNYKQKK